MVWDHVTRDDVVHAIGEYDRLGPAGFFAEHGFGPTTTYDLVWDERCYPPKAILGTAYEFATSQRLDPGLRGREDRRRRGAHKTGIHHPAQAMTSQAKLTRAPFSPAAPPSSQGPPKE
jgi:hypothetical protein